MRLPYHTQIDNSGNALITNWTATGIGETGINFQANDRTVAILATTAGRSLYPPDAEAIIVFQFVADARLGII